jgi:putative peptidoglycan lipid II flippase
VVGHRGRGARGGGKPSIVVLPGSSGRASIMPAMFLRAGALSLALLLASRLLGVLRESAQAAAFGSGGLGDVAVLMLTLPGLAGGVWPAAHWPTCCCRPGRASRRSGGAPQRRVAVWGVALACALALLLLAHRAGPVLRCWAAACRPTCGPRPPKAWSGAPWPCRWPAGGLVGRRGCSTSADFVGMYGANLVVNLRADRALLMAGGGHGGAGHRAGHRPAGGHGRAPVLAAGGTCPFRRARAGRRPRLPGATVWTWAWLSAGLPLALPFVARSWPRRGRGRAGGLQLRLEAGRTAADAGDPAGGVAGVPGHHPGAAPVPPATPARAPRLRAGLDAGLRRGAGLLVASPGLAQLLFGWGRMTPEALAQVARGAAWPAPGACCRRR